jgi:hypothetical protein
VNPPINTTNKLTRSSVWAVAASVSAARLVDLALDAPRAVLVIR